VKKWLAALSVVAVLAAGVVFVVRHEQEQQRLKDRRDARAVAVKFLTAWPAKQYDEMGSLTAADEQAGDSFKRLEQRLKASRVVVVPGDLAKDGRHLPFRVTVTMTGLGELSWTTDVETVKTSRGWRVQFRSHTVYPGLSNGQLLVRSEPLLSRGQLVDRHGTPLRAASADLAANVLGSAGAVKTGLERLYDAQLTGSSGGRVQVVDRVSGTVVTVVKEYPPKPAGSVRTTLDLPLQQAAERALDGVVGQAAIVVLDTATGEVRAVANRPVAGLPAAFRDEAPGSTFKVVVAAAALQRGITPATVVSCPEKVVFGGKEFRNDEPLPARMSFETAFARSCNTAFLTLADGFPKGTVRATAAAFGFGRGALLPTGAQGGDVPVPGSTSEAYADVIGQGKVEASPLLLASMSAAVASGTWRQPHLVTGAADALPLTPRIVGPLQRLMAAVVTSGTAATAGLPAGTHGKTGTAQYGTGVPLPNHAWFTGYRGGLAFCVYVKDGVSGGRTAAPVAARFLHLAGA
jgi:cell division protein FtsI/penicillin-binding protein 2